MPLSPFERRYFTDRCPAAVEHYDRIEAAGQQAEFILDAFICSGNVICEVCNRTLYGHPQHPWDEYLNVTCEGRVVKL